MPGLFLTSGRVRQPRRRYISRVSTDRSPSLLAWQWNGYPAYHGSRANLILHLVSWPFFVSGFLSLLTAPFAGGIVAIALRALGGIVTMALVMVVQGRGHRMEMSPPVPFNGPGDALGRIFLEQLVNFPRFVLTGGLSKAWAAAR
jgi:hypothetical protein